MTETPSLGRFMLALALALAAVVPAASARAQEPEGPPPPAGTRLDPGSEHHELLPDIGRIGSQVAAFGAGSWNPYKVGQGYAVGGYINLPLRRVGPGKLAYEIFVGLSRATSDPFTVTDSVALVANLATGASLANALAGPPRAPFPVRREVRQELRLLVVSPFALKYTVTKFDAWHVRPFVTAGVDILVTITHEAPLRDESLLFTGTAPFDAPLIGGQIAQAPELAERGVPSGQGNIDLGGHGAAGFEVRLTKGLSLNFEYRYTAASGRFARLHTAGGALGFHW